MAFNPDRSDAVATAMKLMERPDPMQAMAQMLAIADVLHAYQSGRNLIEVDEAPTAEGPVDEILHTGEVGETAIHPEKSEMAEKIEEERRALAVQHAAAELRETVSKARVPKPKAKKAKAAKKSKPSREPVREEVGTASQETGNPVPANEDPVPGEQLQAAA